MWLLRFPGVYAPQGDSELLVEALRQAAVPPGARALDLCTGTGLVAIAAARLGAARVHAVDVSRAAALAARCNARARRLPVAVRRRDPLVSRLPEAATARFDVVTANPPYVPAPESPRRGRGRARAWDAGEDGRAYLDPLCRRARELLTGEGVLLVVHSSLCGTDRTLGMLRQTGLKAAVSARHTQPFGPVLRERAAWLEDRGLIDPGQRHEELVVIRAEHGPG